MKSFNLFALLALSLSVAACGGGSTGSNTPTPSPTPSPSPVPPPPSPSPPPPPTPPAVLPNAHGLYPDANGVFPSDAEAGLFANANGWARSFSIDGPIDPKHPFFKSFGNGRSCDSCHRQAEGFSVTTEGLRARFKATNGTDPVFLPVDGANSPLAAVGTLDERQAAYSMLLNRGVFRIGLKVPANAEFEVTKVDDPYGYATPTELSLYRRPLPSANLRFVTDLMWDERETLTDSQGKNCLPLSTVCYGPIDTALAQQANHATTGHAQALSDLSPTDLQAIVSFEKSLLVAQQVDKNAGLLFAADGSGGAQALSTYPFAFGLNDFIGSNAARLPFEQSAFQLFGTWLATGTPPDAATQAARQALVRGQVIFNTKQFFVKDLPGISDIFGNNRFFVNCSTCHSTPNVGTLSVPRTFDIGLTGRNLRKPDMPLYTLRNKTTGEIIETSDPGRAMSTGRWADMSRFKTPGLRGLSTHAPYFHDGSAATIEDVVSFYNTRFGAILSDQEMADLTAFLKSL